MVRVHLRDGQVAYFESGTSGLGIRDHGRVDLVHLGQVVDIYRRCNHHRRHQIRVRFSSKAPVKSLKEKRVMKREHTLQQNSNLQHPTPIRPRLLQNLPNPLNTERRLILDPPRDDSPIQKRDLSRDEDEVPEFSSSGEGLAYGAEVGDIVVPTFESWRSVRG